MLVERRTIAAIQGVSSLHIIRILPRLYLQPRKSSTGIKSTSTVLGRYSSGALVVLSSLLLHTVFRDAFV
jgi:hypothetical protein